MTHVHEWETQQVCEMCGAREAAPDGLLRLALEREHDLREPRHTVSLDPTCWTCRLLNADAALASKEDSDD